MGFPRITSPSGWGHLETLQQDMVGSYSPTVVPAPNLGLSQIDATADLSQQARVRKYFSLLKALLTLKGT